MPAFAPAALATAVVVSALGAVVLCILVVLYGFTPSDEDFPASGRGRLLLTRVGHAIAAACFTATAILIAIVLVHQRTPTPGSVAAPLTTVPGTAAIGEQIARQESRLVRTEARIRELEEALRRRDADESPYLDPVFEQLETGASPGQIVLERWEGEWARSLDRLIAYARY